MDDQFYFCNWIDCGHVAASEAEIDAFARERERDGCAHAFGWPGDDRHLPFEIEFHVGLV